MKDIIKLVEKYETQVVSSREVAKIFDESHENIINNIKLLIHRLIETEHNPEEYFKENSYINKYSIRDKEYLLTKSGFMLVSMELSSNKSDECKLQYIEQFNKMLDRITKQSRKTVAQNYKQGLRNLIEKLEGNETEVLCQM